MSCFHGDHHTPRPCSVIIGLGSHDLGVADIRFSRAILDAAGVEVDSVLLVSKPYEERRAYATARKLWPGVGIVSASGPMTFEEYVAPIGDDRRASTCSSVPCNGCSSTRLRAS
ncbi:hypothetical protein GA0115243_1037115 [Streptomyces sp. ScaeMP-e83]|nr:hypothetical protein GA0115243_1037115 [Streptomyces sp. ScaeMP-e83]